MSSRIAPPPSHSATSSRVVFEPISTQAQVSLRSP
jgi:hypothetical protein